MMLQDDIRGFDIKPEWGVAAILHALQHCAEVNLGLPMGQFAPKIHTHIAHAGAMDLLTINEWNDHPWGQFDDLDHCLLMCAFVATLAEINVEDVIT